jgi:hypothetical protein
MNQVVSNINSEVADFDKSVAALHDVDGLKISAHTDIGNSRVTSVAQLVLNYDPEAMIWQDSPSPALILPSLLKWALFIAIWAAAIVFLRPVPPESLPIKPAPTVLDSVQKQTPVGKKGKSTNKADEIQANANATPVKQSTTDDIAYKSTLYIGLLILAYQLYSHCLWFWRIKKMTYKMSSQRLSIESGIFSKAVNAYELHHLQNGQVYKPWNLRLFGRENLYISGLWLSGIKNAEAVRDLIRNAGQIEASRIEKARFR